MKIIIFSFLFLVSWDLAYAGLSAPTSVEDTGVLPEGIISPRMRTYYINLDNKYGGDRVSGPLAEPLNRKVKWQDVLATRQGHERDLLESSLRAQGFNLNNEGPGAIAADINVNISIQAPVLGYGLTKNNSIGIVVPIYSVKTSVATSFVPNATGKAWLQSLPPSKRLSAAKSLQDGLATTLNSLGYKPLESEDFNALGDIYLVHKYRFYNNKKHAALWRNLIVAPTGKAKDPDKLVDVPTGDGQWDLTTGINYEYSDNIPYSTTQVSYSAYAAYNYQFSDRVERRIPLAEGNPLSPDKEKLDRKLGDQIKTGLGVVIGKPSDGSNFGLSYDYQYMFATSYEGKGSNPIRYRWLEDLEEESELESATFVYSYSTVGAYRRKKFALPLTATISLARPLSGKNVNDADIYYGELTLYF